MSISTQSGMTVTPITDAIGAEVTGIDVSEPLDDAAIDEINQALLDHLVLVIRDQDLSPPAQIAFAKRWGKLVRRIATDFLHPEYPDVLVLSNRKVDGKYEGATQAYAGFTWHQDLTYAERPSMGSMLHALEVPEEGGDTAWANQYLAYETLPADIREKIDGLKAIHVRDRRRNPRAGISDLDRDEFTHDIDRYFDIQVPDWVHPMVRTHPETGRKALFVSPRFTVAIDGMDDAEAQPLLDLLFDHQKRPEFIYRHKWRLGDLVFWDNRCTIHLACGGIKPPGIRHLHRTSIAGDVPF
ncbi:MAG: TauD/TfdA family dioxygenase [Alphaproteobacteria bacterium]|nr:TauD/TfdA family dioxygenase [Alphaproteobacteria bacterium]